MNRWDKRGFTIVELLIVVVVIAILAAITIVAFNGIQNRAKASAAQASASQAVKKALAYAIDNSDQFPADLATVGITDTGDTSYQYTVNNSVSPRTFCITATKSNVSYFGSNNSGSTSTGACAGHGVNGVPPQTNLLTNTSVEVDTVGLQNIGSTGDRTIARIASGSAYSGAYVLRLTVGASGGVAGYGSISGTVPNGRYIGVMWIRSNVALAGIGPYFEGSAVRSPVGQSAGVTLVPNAWTQVWKSVDVTTPGTLKVGFLGGGSGATAPGNYVEIDGFMLVSGDTLPNFADGYTANWAWTGAVGASTSVGPPQ